MERKILALLSSALVWHFFADRASGTGTEQQPASRFQSTQEGGKRKKRDENVFPLYNGVTVSVDLWGNRKQSSGR